MQRQRGELVPVGEVIADLPGPIQAIRKTPPPARRGFTLARGLALDTRSLRRLALFALNASRV